MHIKPAHSVLFCQAKIQFGCELFWHMNLHVYTDMNIHIVICNEKSCGCFQKQIQFVRPLRMVIIKKAKLFLAQMNIALLVFSS